LADEEEEERFFITANMINNTIKTKNTHPITIPAISPPESPELGYSGGVVI